MTYKATAVGILVSLVWSGSAFAQAKKKADTPFELGAIVITARPTRPSAVVELSKLLPEVELAKMRQPFISKIEDALSGDPF